MREILVILLILVTTPQLIGAKNIGLCRTPEFTLSQKDFSQRMIEEVYSMRAIDRHLVDSIYYCSHATYSAIGLVSGGTFEGAIRLTPTELGPYVGWNIIAIVFRHYQSVLDNVVKVYDNGTASSPGPLITSEPYTSDVPGWKWIALSSPVTVPGTGDLWCSVEATHLAGEYPLAVDAGPAVDGKGDWIGPGMWGELQNQDLDYNWQILAIVQHLLDNDAEAVSIDIPSILPPDTTFNPMATVKNVGLDTNTFDVTCDIDPGVYTSTTTVTDLAPDESIQVAFPDEFTFSVGDYTVTVYTELAGDGNPANDTITKEVEVYWTDAFPASIDIPDSVPTDTMFKPQATIANAGTYDEGFLVSCRIEPGGYYKNYSISSIAPNESLQITFNQDFTFTSGVYTVTVYTRLSDDNDRSNDTLEKIIDATGIAEENSIAPLIMSLTAPTICRHDVEIE
ncbi:hypothetical protein AMJ52_08540, partial [candidate division TA06 bacterium DG_78]